jgi:hypothetical protein
MRYAACAVRPHIASAIPLPAELPGDEEAMAEEPIDAGTFMLAPPTPDIITISGGGRNGKWLDVEQIVRSPVWEPTNCIANIYSNGIHVHTEHGKYIVTNGVIEREAENINTDESPCIDDGYIRDPNRLTTIWAPSVEVHADGITGSAVRFAIFGITVSNKNYELGFRPDGVVVWRAAE